MIVVLEIVNMVFTILYPGDPATYHRGLIILGSEFIAIGIGFIIYGVLTMKALKKNFTKFYT